MVGGPIWTPSAQRSASSRLASFLAHLANGGVSGLDDTRALHCYSCEHAGEFWRHLWAFAAMQGDPGDVDVAGDSFESTAFFPHGTVDVAATMLQGTGDDVVAVSCDDTGTLERVTRAELRGRVASVADALRTAGVARGDVVAAWSTTSATTLTLMLATAACGAVFTSSSAEFGVDAVVDRFAQVHPSVLLVVDGYRYGGRRHDVRRRACEIVAALPTVRLAITSGDVDLSEPHCDVVAFESIIATPPVSPLATTTVGFNDPGCILYSSGTTGPPKCIEHRAGGVLLKHLSEQLLHCDIRPGDQVFYYTTTSWMMWNWLVSALAAGACVALYDGAPLAPDPQVLLELAARERVTYFGVSPTYLETLRRAEVDAGSAHDLSAVRTIAVTGAPLAPRTAMYVAGWGDDIHVLSKSGGTDLCGGLITGDPTAPVYAGELQAPAYGCEIAVVDADGTDLPVGETGELVSRTPFPSMPLGFVGDDGTRFHEQYYARFPGCWHQSDFVSRTEHGGYVVHGRSDTTLNVNGVRIGTAEIYAQLGHVPWVRAAAAIAFTDADVSSMVLLVELADGRPLDDAMRGEIRHLLRERCSPRHVPGVIEAVVELPRTANGKLSEVAATEAVNGRADPGGSLANPGSLTAIRAIGERLAARGA